MAVLPESMDRLNVSDPSGSLSIIENYIRYMGERIEFSMRNMTKTVSAAGVSSAEMYVLVTAMSNTLSALQSTVNGISGDVTGLSGRITELSGKVAELETAVTELRTALTSLQAHLSAMDARLAALEQKGE